MKPDGTWFGFSVEKVIACMAYSYFGMFKSLVFFGTRKINSMEGVCCVLCAFSAEKRCNDSVQNWALQRLSGDCSSQFQFAIYFNKAALSHGEVLLSSILLLIMLFFVAGKWICCFVTDFAMLCSDVNQRYVRRWVMLEFNYFHKEGNLFLFLLWSEPRVFHQFEICIKKREICGRGNDESS